MEEKIAIITFPEQSKQNKSSFPNVDIKANVFEKLNNYSRLNDLLKT